MERVCCILTNKGKRYWYSDFDKAQKQFKALTQIGAEPMMWVGPIKGYIDFTNYLTKLGRQKIAS